MARFRSFVPFKERKRDAHTERHTLTYKKYIHRDTQTPKEICTQTQTQTTRNTQKQTYGRNDAQTRSALGTETNMKSYSCYTYYTDRHY